MPKAKTNKETGQTIALTGATGFLGGHTLNALVEAGHTVQALTRRTQSEQDGVRWIAGNLGDENSLEALVTGADTLIHVAGLTKALTRDDFFDVNVGGTLKLFKAAAAAGVKHVIHISSLAAREPRLSHYGASKAGSELLLTARKWPFSWCIIRPPGIYGPGDKEILKLIKAAKVGILPALGSKQNRFSMIHAADLAAAITHLTDGSHKTQTLEIDDGAQNGYSYSDVAAVLGTDKKPLMLTVPFPVLGFMGAVNQLVARMIHRPAMLTLSTARYLCHTDWTARESLKPKLSGWSPQFDLTSGIRNTVDWYKKNGLL